MRLSRSVLSASAAVTLVAVALLTGCSGNTGRAPQTTTQTTVLTPDDVTQVVTTAAASVSTPLVIAVVDRGGNVLGVYHKANAPATGRGNFSTDVDADELAVSLARTGAFFSNNEAPLSSRTVRFISGIHFPPGVSFTPNAALYGIENTNRGCALNATFVPGQAINPAVSLKNHNNADPRQNVGLGITTGKADVFDSDPTAVNPGGVPIFKNGEVVGGIGVVGGSAQVSEFAAFTGSVPATNSCGAPDMRCFGPSVPDPGAVLIDGIRLPFVDQTTRPAGVSSGSADGAFVVPPTTNGTPVPEGDLVAPHAGAVGGLSADEVRSIVDHAIATANNTRAAIRLPIGKRTRMVIAVADLDGTLLALHRMPDATVFSIDVAVAKARNMTYFNTPQVAPNDLPGVPPGTAVTNRTISFGGQPLFPAGIDGTQPGPFFDLYVRDVANPCSQGSQPQNPNQSGIVFFPGSEGLYRNGTLIGGLGVSGDGVEQDDFVTSGGAQGFEPPANIRSDQVIIRNTRLPYLKFPRNPTF